MGKQLPAGTGLGSFQLGALRDAYRSGALDPREVAALVSRRAAERSGDNIWTTLRDPADLLAEAEEIGRRWPDASDRPPLFGVPVAVKDNIDVAGMATTAACPEFSYLPSEPAPLVRRLVDAGALVVGKTNLDQFATGLTGTRSPYGLCRSAFDPERISGGSSSGSALAVAHGLVSIAIGTDTAGSGRVPAAFANIVGLKPSRGLVSGRGIVPACRSLDCPSVFALSVPDASQVLSIIAGPDPADPWSRDFTAGQQGPGEREGGPRIAVPGDRWLSYVEDPQALAAFRDATARLAASGATLAPVDIEPFLLAGDLLYQGPWVAERLTHLEEFLVSKPDSVFPVTREVLSAARGKTAAEAFRGMHRLAELRRAAAPVWDQADALLLPTAPASPTVAQALADPHGVNAKLGRYTNFCNLLDLAAVSVPAAFLPGGIPFGLTFYAPAGADRLLAEIAGGFHAGSGLPAGATGLPLLPAEPAPPSVSGPASVIIPVSAPVPAPRPARVAGAAPGLAVASAGREPADDTMLLAVVGAHRTGQPLNGRLYELGGRHAETVLTAPVYRLVALSGAGASRPGLVRVVDGGCAVEAELHRIPATSLGALLSETAAPLGLGVVELADGRAVTGFLCEGYAMDEATDITGFGSWPAYLEQQAEGVGMGEGSGEPGELPEGAHGA